MLASLARGGAFRGRSAGSSDFRVMTSWLFSMAIPIELENVRWSSPFGPLTWMLEPFTSTLTPPGISIGNRPIRDTLYLLPLPDLAKDLATHTQLAGAGTGHNTLGCREDGNAKPR